MMCPGRMVSYRETFSNLLCASRTAAVRSHAAVLESSQSAFGDHRSGQRAFRPSVGRTGLPENGREGSGRQTGNGREQTL